jgi:hypothetical protein
MNETTLIAFCVTVSKDKPIIQYIEQTNAVIHRYILVISTDNWSCSSK